jgi:transposase-like protein
VADDYDARQISDEHIKQIVHQAARDDQSIGAICRSYGIDEATLLPLTQEVRRDDP